MASEGDTVTAGVVGKLDWLRTSMREQPEGGNGCSVGVDR